MVGMVVEIWEGAHLILNWISSTLFKSHIVIGG